MKTFRTNQREVQAVKNKFADATTTTEPSIEDEQEGLEKCLVKNIFLLSEASIYNNIYVFFQKLPMWILLQCDVPFAKSPDFYQILYEDVFK